MTRIVVLGFAPLPIENLRMSGPSLRTWHFVSMMLNAGHEVCLIANRGLDIYPADLPDIVSQQKDRLLYHNVSNSQWHSPAGLVPLVQSFAPDCAVGVTTSSTAAAVPLIGTLPLWGDLYGSIMAEAQMKAQVYGDDSYLAHFWSLEQAAIERADRFSAVSERQQWALIGELGMIGRLNQYTAGYDFATTIPIASESTPYTSTRKVVRGSVVPEDAFIIFYSGGYNTWTDVDCLFQALEQILSQYPNVYFVSTGGKIEGHDDLTFARFQTMIRSSNQRDRYKLQGWVPAEDVPNYYLESDLAVNVDKRSYEAILGSRTRVLDWLRAGLPCVMSSLPELADDVLAAGAGLTYEPGSVTDLTARLRYCLDNLEAVRQMRQCAQQLLGKFSYEATTRDLLKWLEQPAHAPDFEKNVPKLAKPVPPPPAITNALSTRRMVLLAVWRRVDAFSAKLGIPSHRMRSLARTGRRWLGYETQPFKAAYRHYTVPKRMKAGQTYTGKVVIDNQGDQVWRLPEQDDHAVNLSYHWLNLEGQVLEREGKRSPLPHPVKPRSRVIAPITILAPTQPGFYQIEIDLVREGVAWFSELAVPVLRFRVEIE
ncbi:MAG: glycosyltransferase [Anaerolineae bacterium]|nr:glycosyltransferase [Anaerolineae bacterium]